jgi:predicted  nucleic acid-binding Zn-ribbon protein
MDQPNSISTWTEYQQLVLNELQRHEAKLNAMAEEIVGLKLALARLEIELKGLNIQTVKASEQIKTIDLARETNNLNVRLLTYKLSFIVGSISGLFGILTQVAVKYFLH